MINITVTGDNAADVLAQLRTLVGVGSVAAVITTEAPAEDKPTVGTEAAKRVRKAKPVEEPNAETQAAIAEAEAGETVKTGDVKEAVAELNTLATDLDFDTDVAPKVLAAVQKAGKPTVTELLAEFGVERASQLEADRWPELVERLADLG